MSYVSTGLGAKLMAITAPVLSEGAEQASQAAEATVNPNVTTDVFSADAEDSQESAMGAVLAVGLIVGIIYLVKRGVGR